MLKREGLIKITILFSKKVRKMKILRLMVLVFKIENLVQPDSQIDASLGMNDLLAIIEK